MHDLADVSRLTGTDEGSADARLTGNFARTGGKHQIVPILIRNPVHTAVLLVIIIFGVELAIMVVFSLADVDIWLPKWARDSSDAALLSLVAGILIYFLVVVPQQRVLEHTERINRLLHFLSHVNTHVQKQPSQQELFDAACKAAVEIGKFRIAWIGMMQDGDLQLAAWAGAPPLSDVLRLMQSPQALGTCLGAQCAIKNGETAFCDLRGSVGCDAPWLASALELGCDHAIAMPLKVSGKTVGLLEVYAGENGQLSEDEQAILEEVAADVSATLVNIRHEQQRKANEEKLRMRLSDLERLQKATIGREFRIKELRDEIAKLKQEHGAVQENRSLPKKIQKIKNGN